MSAFPLPGSFSSENVCVVPGALSNVTREMVVAETADAVAKISADAVFIVRLVLIRSRRKILQG